MSHGSNKRWGRTMESLSLALRQVSQFDMLHCSHLLNRWQPFIIYETPWFSNMTRADSSVRACMSVYTVSLCVCLCIRGGLADSYLQKSVSVCGSCPSASNPLWCRPVWTASGFSPTQLCKRWTEAKQRQRERDRRAEREIEGDRERLVCTCHS